MKKIGIYTTYYNNCNYGGVLQAYSLQKKLIDLGYEVEDVCYRDRCDESAGQSNLTAALNRNFRGKNIREKTNTIFRIVYKKVLEHKHENEINSYIEERRNAISEFRENCIIHSNLIYDKLTVAQTLENYDIFLCGSDMIWNLGTECYFEPGYWLSFVKNKKKIAYGASLSMKDVSLQQREGISCCLKDFSAISVREEIGKTILKKCETISKNIDVVVDPVFLNDESFWKSEMSEKLIDKDYVFSYFLGDSEENRKIASEFAEKNNCVLISIPYLLDYFRLCDFGFGTTIKKPIGIREFLSLVYYAKYILTDSFHGVAFSLIFGKRVWAFNRTSEDSGMNTRVAGLLREVGLDKLLVHKESDLNCTPYTESNLKNARDKINIKVEKSLRYLINAIEL